jgi:5-oxoprolinase (ATP-hydrolysing)
MSWEFSIDRGGTFTDVVARAPDGRLVVEKLLSADPRYADAAAEGVRRILAAHGGGAVSAVKIGTTVATNALLERKGASTALVITQGHADALRIGWQARPQIFARHIVLPSPLYDHVVEARERVTADGEVLTPLDEVALAQDLAGLKRSGVKSVAIVFLHGWRHTAHEKRAAALARAMGFKQVSVSHEIAPLVRLVSRGDTTVVDAYLSPVLRTYVAKVTAALERGPTLLFMQSSGGLVAASAFRGKDAVLSGPAGGVVGMAAAGRAAGADRLIGFDMGGTSTDVAHFAGDYERAAETTIVGVRLRAPILAVHTVAAGGGSICRFDGARLRVGPQSAGAEPGPACYRRGGPLTITDCNVALGKILPAHFPAVFGAAGDAPLDAAASLQRLEETADAVARTTGVCPAARDLAEGFLAVAVETMAAAIRAISIERGHDVAEHTLVAFGGAGGQHACLVADALGVERVLLHPLAGVLSAWGIGLAPLQVVREATVDALLDEGRWRSVLAQAEALGADAEKALHRQGCAVTDVTSAVRVTVRAPGADAALPLPALADAAAMRDAFSTAHRTRFGFAVSEAAPIVDTLTVEVTGRPLSADGRGDLPPAGAAASDERVYARFAGIDHETPVYQRDALGAGAIIDGPAVIVERAATSIVEPGWRGAIDQGGALTLTRIAPLRLRRGDTTVDPVRLELFNNRFMAIAERMGATLQGAAASVNIKERLDFSCAVFDGGGALVANAPHIPVHLGSMSESVRAILRTRAGTMRAGDAFMLNAPWDGGTHLPDITVVMPVFVDDAPAYYVAARGHHADVGGISPGSMPPRSRTIDEEGVVIADAQLVAEGQFLEDTVRVLFARGPHPARNIDQNVADLKAQLAACAAGAAELQRLAADHDRAVVDAYMGHVQANAAECVARVLETLRSGAFVNRLDDGSEIAVRIDVDNAARTAKIDFAGTSAQHPGNFNAPSSVVRAAVLYVFRTLVDDAIPLNDGCMRPLTLRTPEGSMLNPRPPAAVVAGNVETSQAIVDALYGALGVLAASQGTMNNLTFGDAEHQYYETICGGSGAGPGFPGASAVQTHMTNSRLTDPEVLEMRHPVLVERFAIRAGSGGDGAQRGGDGVVRRLRFRRAMHAAILSSRRATAPFGLDGGAAAQPGVNRVLRADGKTEVLGPTDEAALAAGDAIEIETPGGGGFGQRDTR